MKKLTMAAVLLWMSWAVHSVSSDFVAKEKQRWADRADGIVRNIAPLQAEKRLDRRGWFQKNILKTPPSARYLYWEAMQNRTGSSADGDSITFPVLVIGPDGYTKSVILSSSDGGAVDSIYMRVHNIAYIGESSAGDANPSGESKGRFRINGGSWVEINNVNCTSPILYERLTGGLSVFPVSKVNCDAPGSISTGNNTVEFQFRADSLVRAANEGHGYRLLDLAWKESGGGYQRDYVRVDDDPSTWTAPPGSSVADGRSFVLDSTITGDGIGTSTRCITCHTYAGSGRDLPMADLMVHMYEPITWAQVVLDRREADSSATHVQQAADDVVAYGIAGQQDSLPNFFTAAFNASYEPKDLARPWSFPLQGCNDVDTDTMAVEFWFFSGGYHTDYGANCVLEDDRDMKSQLFADTGGDISYRSASMHPDSTVPHHRIESPIQNAGWNFWIPRADPYLIWDGASGRMNFGTSTMENQWETTLPGYIAGGNKSTIADGFDTWWEYHNDFEGAGYGDSGNFNPAFAESGRARLVNIQWLNIKHFEFIFFDHLEENAATGACSAAYPTPYKRQWPACDRSRVMFDFSMHITGADAWNYGVEGTYRDRYHDTWPYEVQCGILNSGSGKDASFRPCDWKYTFSHIADMQRNETSMHVAYRWAKMYLHAIQNGTNGGASDDYMTRHLSFQRVWTSIGGQKWPLNNMDSGDRLSLVEEIYRAQLDFLFPYDSTDWAGSCGTGIGDMSCATVNVTEGGTVNSGTWAGFQDDFDQFNYAESFYRGLHNLALLGGAATLQDSVAQVGQNYGWQVTSGDDWTTFMLSSAPVSAPTLSMPVDDDTDTEVVGSLSWGSVADASTYDIQLDDDIGFGSPLIDANQAGLSRAYSVSNGTEYFWRVRGRNSFGAGPWSSTFSFTTVAAITYEDQDWASGGSKSILGGDRMSVTGQGTFGTLPGAAGVEGFGTFLDFADGDTAFVRLDSLRGTSTSFYKTFSLLAIADLDSTAQMVSAEVSGPRIRLVTRTVTGAVPLWRESDFVGSTDGTCLRLVRSGTGFSGAYRQGGGDCTVDSGYTAYSTGSITLPAAVGDIKVGLFASGGASNGTDTAIAYITDFIVR